MSEKRCQHDEQYPVAVFMTLGTPWIWMTCDECGTNEVIAGDFANDREE